MHPSSLTRRNLMAAAFGVGLMDLLGPWNVPGCAEEGVAQPTSVLGTAIESPHATGCC